MNNQLKKIDPRRDFFPSFFKMNDDFFTDFFKGSNMPAVNIVENNKEFRIELSVPGFNKDDFKIEIEKNVLTISASQESKREEKNEDEKIHRQEFYSTSFSRSFVLPENIDTEHISAEQKDGILKIALPKLQDMPEDKVKKIEIK
ncbi:Hsp20/alpha crystallin family protein [Dysgonomonas sp.]|jgi:HSP20 family protein|nr:Hsp20/alpha crystallin family protein [Prevotella sp.]